MRLLKLCVLIAILLSTVSATAQERTPRVLPVDAKSMRAAISPDSLTIAVWDDGIIAQHLPDPAYLLIHVFDLESEAEVATLAVNDYPSAVTFTTGGERLVALLANGDLIQWNASDYTEIGRVFTGLIASGGMIAAPRPDTVLIRTGAFPPLYALYNLDSGAIEHIIAYRLETYAELQSLISDGTERYQLTDVAFAITPDASTLVTFSADGRLNLIKLDNFNRLRFAPSENTTVPSFPVTDINFTPTGELVYYHTDDEMTRVTNARNGEILAELPYGGASMAVSPDGMQIAYLDRREGGVFLAPLTETGNPVQIGTITDVRFTMMTQMYYSPDASRLIIAGGGNPEGTNGIYIFDLQ